MNIDVKFVNRKVDDEIHGYFDTKGQPHLISAELVEYRDARVAVMLLDNKPVCGYTLLSKNSDDAIKEIRLYLEATFDALKNEKDLFISPLVYLNKKLYYIDRVFQEDD